jgi:hypothetical protein
MGEKFNNEGKSKGHNYQTTLVVFDSLRNCSASCARGVLFMAAFQQLDEKKFGIHLAATVSPCHILHRLHATPK